MFATSTRVSFESEACPGVTVTLRRLSPSRRCSLERSQAALRAKQRDLMRRFAAQIVNPGVAAGEPCEKCGHAVMAQEGDSPEVVQSKLAEQRILTYEADPLEHELDLTILPVYVDKIEGLVVDGKEFTIEDVIAEGPEELADEIKIHIGDLRLSAVESKNSPPSTTSEPAVDGTTKPTTATTAEEKGTGASETAGSISPSA